MYKQEFSLQLSVVELPLFSSFFSPCLLCYILFCVFFFLYSNVKEFHVFEFHFFGISRLKSKRCKTEGTQSLQTEQIPRKKFPSRFRINFSPFFPSFFFLQIFPNSLSSARQNFPLFFFPYLIPRALLTNPYIFER